MKRNLFVLPISATDGETGDGGDAGSALDTIAGLSEVFDAIDNDNPQNDDSTNQNDNPNNSGTEDDDTSDDDNSSDDGTRNAEDKSNKAFGQMRIQIKQQNKLLGKVADALGIEYKSSEELLQKLNDNALESLAEKQGVPKELLQRLEYLECISTQFEEQRLHDNALAGFQRLHTEFGLDDKALQSFAAELDATDQNPFVKDLDVVTLYKTMHFDDIVQAKVEAAVAEALSKDTQVSQRSSTPAAGGAPGAGDGGDKVTTVAGLTAMLNTITK